MLTFRGPSTSFSRSRRTVRGSVPPARSAQDGQRQAPVPGTSSPPLPCSNQDSVTRPAHTKSPESDPRRCVGAVTGDEVRSRRPEVRRRAEEARRRREGPGSGCRGRRGRGAAAVRYIDPPATSWSFGKKGEEVGDGVERSLDGSLGITPARSGSEAGRPATLAFASFSCIRILFTHTEMDWCERKTK